MTWCIQVSSMFYKRLLTASSYTASSWSKDFVFWKRYQRKFAFVSHQKVSCQVSSMTAPKRNSGDPLLWFLFHKPRSDSWSEKNCMPILRELLSVDSQRATRNNPLSKIRAGPQALITSWGLQTVDSFPPICRRLLSSFCLESSLFLLVISSFFNIILVTI